MKLMREQKSVSKNDVMELLHLDENQAYYQLRKLVGEDVPKRWVVVAMYDMRKCNGRRWNIGRTVLIRDYP